MLELTILNHNWGSLRLAPHKSYTRENRCTDLCHDVCVMYVNDTSSTCSSRVRAYALRNRYGKDPDRVLTLNVVHQQLKGSSRSNNEIKRKLENEEVGNRYTRVGPKFL